MIDLHENSWQAPDSASAVVIDGRRYRFGACLHEDENSRIYTASQEESRVGSAFVVKVIRFRHGSGEEADAMRERDMMRLLRGVPHTVRLLGSRTAILRGGQGALLLLMKRLRTCEEVFGSKRADEARVTALCRDISCALRQMARLGLVHGDVKPANLFLDEAEGWQLGDFGSAVPLGKPPRFVTEGYCSPQARRGEPCDEDTDRYALGVTAYRLLSGGRLPFCPRPCEEMAEEEVYAAISRRMRGEPVPPLDGVSEVVNRMVAELMERGHDR